MTIHGAKGLQAPVVVVAGIFNAGKSDASLAVRNNVLVTPQVVAGRINPWTSRERPDDGLWEFAKRMDHAQRQAERRREFYVALTRVKDRLIVVGSPSDTAEVNADTNLLEFKSNPSMKTMGAMWLDGLRSLSHSNCQENSPWLLSGDEFGKPLQRYESTKLSLNPRALIENSYLGGDAIESIHLYHSPDCFPDLDVQTPLQKWRSLEIQLGKTPPQPSLPVRYAQVSDIMRMTAHGLDTSFVCPRRHWLAEVRGWNPEPLERFSKSKPSETSSSLFPPATVFGTLMHRLVEIGLQNPAQLNSPASSPLPSAWIYEGKDLLDDETTLRRVLAEEGIGEGDSHSTIHQVTLGRLAHLGGLVRNGLLGRLADGESHFGYTVEGLRTELPFYFSHKVTFDGLVRTTFSIEGPRPQALVDHVDVVFDGRADLVLALRDAKGKGCLQVVDLKTKGCRDQFNPDDSNSGSQLQKFKGDLLSPFPASYAERSLLDEHRLQLTLYSLALEVIEQQKPEHERRRVLPPSLLIGASGRMVQLSEEEFAEAKINLLEHLTWMAQLSATPDALEEPARLPEESADVCTQCPFSRGKIRLCGPKGVELGPLREDE